MMLEIPAHTLQLLAAAYELSPDEVEQDFALLQGEAPPSIQLLEGFRRRHNWHASTCVYYLAACRRVLRGLPPWM